MEQVIDGGHGAKRAFAPPYEVPGKTLHFDATCARFSRYHLMAMSNEEIFSPDRPRRQRPFPEPRGPVIDQDGREIPDAALHPQFQGFRFDFGTAGANPFGTLTREQRLARLDALAKLLDV